MIKLRLDVDYPYPSRLQSFLFTTLNLKISKNYVKNSKIIAKMINESSKEVMAYWFFTPQTIPDAELLSLLHPEKHEVALHVATKPYPEWKNLERATNRKVKYYTVHGTARLIARLMWRRKIWESKAPIPEGFPLKSFYDYATIGLDVLCYRDSTDQAVRIARNHIAKGEVLHVHPEWLLQRGTLNHRGPYYDTLKTLLGVDDELDLLTVRKKGLIRIARYPEHYEYLHDYAPTERFLEKLNERGTDIFTFVERKWCRALPNPPKAWLKSEDNIALLHVPSYEEWWNGIGKKTRNMIRKAEKSGVKTQVAEPTETLAAGIWKIYHETPVRQGRAFSHYGLTLDMVKTLVAGSKDSTFIGSYLGEELVGFIQLVQGNNIVVMSQILSLQRHWDKAVNNALVAKAVEICAARNAQWLMYGRMGNHPTLDSFKESNGFSKYPLTRYYVPITMKGRMATKLELHREAKDALPHSLKGPLIPLFNWISRTKIQFKLRLRR
jgi:hypothetical protein